MNKKIGESIQICGVSVSGSPRGLLLSALEQELATRQSQNTVFVTTPNPEQVVQASLDDTFRHILNQSEISFPDGVGLVWAAKLLRGVSLQRMPGVEVAQELVEFAWKNDLSVMILGGTQGVAEQALENLKSKIKNQNEKLKCKSFALAGSNDISRETTEERDSVFAEIKNFKPDLLLVAYGAPWQEMWIYNNSDFLAKSGVAVAMVVGGAVDVWAGRVNRAPFIVRKVGFEWLWRLVTQPWRWKRQLRLLKFVGMVLREKVGEVGKV